MYGSLYAEGSPNHGSCPWVAYPHINNHIQIVLVIFAMRPFYMITFSYRGERVSQNTYQVQNVKVPTEQRAIYYFIIFTVYYSPPTTPAGYTCYNTSIFVKNS
ncbi:hypothetical protein GQX74_001217 [Glossina fuscipes]|nr:hypothetical protein GQX74_001217 [Glossina fuscipes]